MTAPFHSMPGLARRFPFVGLALATVLAIGTAGFMLVEGYSLIDAFYTTLPTMTTAGYVTSCTPPAGYSIPSYRFVGVTTILAAIGAITQTVVEARVLNSFGDF